MKNRYIILGALLALSGFAGCSEDFLDRPPKDTLVDANFYKTNDQVLASTAPLYSAVWKDYHDKASYNLGDFRAGTAYRAWGDRDNVLFNTTDVSPRNNEAYKAFYVVVGQANMAIQNINTYAGEAVSPEIKNHALAEARFMRATAYAFLVSNYGAVPVIENNVALLADSSLTRNTVPSVWEFITRDYLFAAENLAATPMQPGRLTKWSAEAMLARTYLTRAGVESSGGMKKQEFLDKAKDYAHRVINMSGKALLQNYEDLFRFPYDNNTESLFELQWVFTTDYGFANTMTSQITYSNEIANGDGWGGDIGASYWMLSLYEGLFADGFTNDKRLKATFMMPGFHYPEITRIYRDAAGKEVKEKLTFPAPAGNADASFASIKKYVVGKAEDLGGQATGQRYPHNNYMLRLAEMYLIYAEATIGNNESTMDQTALDYFNKVHTRAGLPPHPGPLRMDKVYDADPAKYKDDILEERMREFAFEGLAWYDFVRLHYYNPQKAYDIINNQDRGLFVVKPNRMPNPSSWTITRTSWFADRKANANSGNFQLPIPAAEASQAPNLRKPPVPYKF